LKVDWKRLGKIVESYDQQRKLTERSKRSKSWTHIALNYAGGVPP